jgi:predicted transcriptional regulator
MAQSAEKIRLDDKLWAQFAQAAKRSRKDPLRLLAELVREYLDQQEAELLNRKSIKAAKGKVSEDDDIEGIIRELRKEQFGKA